jgi:putative colanic acid biosynthesis acetyltransferase WcaF
MRKLRESHLTTGNKVYRLAFRMVWALICLPTPVFMFEWRRIILCAFGAKLAKGVKIYQSVKIFDPRNLIVESEAVIGPRVKLYSVDLICIGKNALVSQDCHLCTATHDYRDPDFKLMLGKIIIEERVWVAAEVFIGPGVSVRKNSVIYARSVVARDISEDSVIAGNPGKLVGKC